MKWFRLLAASVCLLSFNLNAQTPLKAWAGQSVTVSNGVDTVQSLIVSAYSGDPQGYGVSAPGTPSGTAGLYRGPAYATYIQTFSDNGVAKLQFYTATNSFAITGTNGTLYGWSVGLGGTNIPVPYSTNASGTPIGATNNVGTSTNVVAVIRHKATDTYERNRIWGAFGTNVIFLYPPVTQPAAGDIVYLYAPGPQWNVSTNGSTMLSANQGVLTFNGTGAPGLINGVNPGTPFLMEITGGTRINTNQINAAGGFLP